MPPEDILGGEEITGSLSPPKTVTQGTRVYTTRNALDAKDPSDATKGTHKATDKMLELEKTWDLCLYGRLCEHQMQHMPYANYK